MARLQFKRDYDSAQGSEMVEPRKSQMDAIIKNLQSKVGLAFNNSVELVRWLSLTGRDQVKPEEFWFGVRFFSLKLSFANAMLLFQQLDTGKDGLLDA